MFERTRVASLLLAGVLGSAVAASADPWSDYMLHCQGCHGADGAGSRDGAPPFAGNFARLAQSEEGRTYLLRVPGVQAAELDAARLAAVLNWIAQRYDREEAQRYDFRPFTAEEVARALGQPLVAQRAERGRVLGQEHSAK